MRYKSTIFWIIALSIAASLLLWVLGLWAGQLLVPVVRQNIRPPHAPSLPKPREVSKEEEAIIAELEEKGIVILRFGGPVGRPRAIIADSRHATLAFAEAQAISKLKSLEEIQLKVQSLNDDRKQMVVDFGIDDKFANAICTLSNVKVLSLPTDNLTLDGYRSLSKMKSLIELSISSKHFEQEHFEPLKDLHNLRLLSVSTVPASVAQGLLPVAKALPRCKIVVTSTSGETYVLNEFTSSR